MLRLAAVSNGEAAGHLHGGAVVSAQFLDFVRPPCACKYLRLVPADGWGEAQRHHTQLR